MKLQTIIKEQGCVKYTPSFLNKKKADELLIALNKTINWQQKYITIFGKRVKEPRLTAWHGDPNTHYTYSGETRTAAQWTNELLYLKRVLQEKFQSDSNSVLLNQYRTGLDYMGWHRDNEKELGDNPIIYSISLGVTRDFKLKHINDKTKIINQPLEHGSLLIMSGDTQTFWKHSLPKRKKVHSTRVNLTFRNIKTK